MCWKEFAFRIVRYRYFWMAGVSFFRSLVLFFCDLGLGGFVFRVSFGMDSGWVWGVLGF